MATSAASSEHFEKLHEIFRGLLEDLQGVPERLLGTVGTGEAGAGPDGENSTGRGLPNQHLGLRAPPAGTPPAAVRPRTPEVCSLL